MTDERDPLLDALSAFEPDEPPPRPTPKRREAESEADESSATPTSRAPEVEEDPDSHLFFNPGEEDDSATEASFTAPEREPEPETEPEDEKDADDPFAAEDQPPAPVFPPKSPPPEGQPAPTPPAAAPPEADAPPPRPTRQPAPEPERIHFLLGQEVAKRAPEGRDPQDVMGLIRQDAVYQAGAAKSAASDEDESAPQPKPAGLLADLRRIDLSEMINIRLDSGLLKYIAIIGAGLLVLWLAFSNLSVPGLGGAAEGPALHYVHFSARIQGARTVSVVGDFNDWTAGVTPLGQLPNSTVWEAWVPVEPGRYRYAFIIDGKQHYIEPGRPLDTQDGRGVSVLFVPREGGPPDMTGGAEAASSPNIQ